MGFMSLDNDELRLSGFLVSFFDLRSSDPIDSATLYPENPDRRFNRRAGYLAVRPQAEKSLQRDPVS